MLLLHVNIPLTYSRILLLSLLLTQSVPCPPSTVTATPSPAEQPLPILTTVHGHFCFYFLLLIRSLRSSLHSLIVVPPFSASFPLSFYCHSPFSSYDHSIPPLSHCCPERHSCATDTTTSSADTTGRRALQVSHPAIPSTVSQAASTSTVRLSGWTAAVVNASSRCICGLCVLPRLYSADLPISGFCHRLWNLRRLDSDFVSSLSETLFWGIYTARCTIHCSTTLIFNIRNIEEST